MHKVTKQLNQRGQLFILSLIVVTLIMVNSVLIINNALTTKTSSNYSSSEVQAIHLAEAGIDKAIEALNRTAGSYNGEAETQLGDGSFSVTVTSVDASNKFIDATGYIPNKADPRVRRTVRTQVVKGAGTSFNYGVQVGEGGLQMQNNARINGSVYSNGNIVMTNGSRIAGDAYVAGGTQPTANQGSDCTSPNCNDNVFGRLSNNQLDLAQSFRPSITAVINRVSLKVKKTGAPADVTVRILSDNNGNPNKNGVITSGTLSANLVTGEYSFVDVAFSSAPTLTANTTYWIMVDTSANTNNYWSWSGDSTQGYTRGAAKWSPNWQASNPVWNNISADLGFNIYMGGVVTSITGSNSAVITGNAYANTINSMIINGGAYYQSITNSTVGSHHPGSVDPPPAVMPISDANLAAWKDEAVGNGTFTGDINGCQATLASGKYVGNITLTNGCITTMQDPIWITGNLMLDNGAVIRLNSNLGASSGVLIVEGTIKLSNNGQLRGTGASGSYLLGISTFDSRTNNVIAIDADNGSSSSILYAPLGSIILKNNANLREVTGWRLFLDNGSTVSYDSGIANLSFTSGPSGEYTPVKGSYKIR